MLVVGILSAIAVPAFLGARNTGYDKEAQASVEAAMVAARNYYTQYGDFSSHGTDQCFSWTSTLQNELQRLEPNVDFTRAYEGSTGPKVVSVASWFSYNAEFESLGCQVFYATALSRSGTCWIGRISVEGKYFWPVALEYGGSTYAPIIVQGDKNSENEEQVSMTDAPLNGNAFAAFKAKSPAADQDPSDIDTLAAAQSLCNAFDSVEGIFQNQSHDSGLGLVRTYEYYDSWRNVITAASGVATGGPD
jgi:type II secretory pathway pseudopilin PulG